MNREDIKILQSCLQMMESMTPPFSESDLFKLSGLLRSFEHSDQPELRKLAEIPEHFFPQMEHRHFLNFIVPLERALGRRVRDDHFVILREDRKKETQNSVPLVFILDNLRSAFNVGSLFRLADCLSIEEVCLAGYTPNPLQEQLQKTSLGAVESVQWQTASTGPEAIANYKQKNFQICALETAQNSVSLYQFQFTGPTAFVVGNERFGLESRMLEICDQVISIPTFGVKNSLNVSQAMAVAAYEFQRQWSCRGT